MAVSTKNILITPYTGDANNDPKIDFFGANANVNTTITMKVYPDSNGTLSFEGSAGQLFSITNDLTGSIFSVSDVSGLPILDVNANTNVNISSRSYTTNAAPALTLTDTWANANLTFTAIKVNIANTAAAAGSKILDLQVNGTSYWTFQNFDAGGNKTPALVFGDATQSRAMFRTISAGLMFSRGDGANDYLVWRTVGAPGSVFGLGIAPGAYIGWDSGSGGAGTLDTMFSRAGAANLQFGYVDAPSPVSQTLQVQSANIGQTNMAGADWNFNASRGTGTGAGGAIKFNVAPAGTTGNTQNPWQTALTINGDKSATFASNITTSGIVNANLVANSVIVGGNLVATMAYANTMKQVYIGNTAPANPQAGWQWFNPDLGKTFIYYTDADSSQWVESSSPSQQRVVTETSLALARKVSSLRI